MTTSRQTRRQFLSNATKTALGAGVASTLPFGTFQAFGGSANERLRVGVMGTSRNSVGGDGRGTSLARQFAQHENTEVVYICDVDSRNVGKAMESVSEHQKTPMQGTDDFRRILDDKSVDVLVIAAPDHWHGPAAIFGAQAGKHVYVEKPCCHNPAEGEMMRAAAKENKIQMQVGTQRRSFPALREVMQRLRAGDFGKIASASCVYFNERPSIGTGKVAPVPDWLNWEMWQGPAPRIDYRDNIVHYNWHWFWKWGTGELGNNGVHTIDVCRWGLGVDYPLGVRSLGNQLVKDDQETPDENIAVYQFDDLRFLSWKGQSRKKRGKDDPQFECEFATEKGNLQTQGGAWKLVDFDGREIEKGSGRGGDMDHIGNLLAAIRGEAELHCPITEGYKSTLLCHLGNISWRIGQDPLEVDPETGKLKTDNKDALALWSRDYNEEFRPKAG